MTVCLMRAPDFDAAFPSLREQVSVHARTVEAVSGELLDLAREALRTNDDASYLFHVASGLRDRLDAIVTVAKTKADDLTGARVVGRITETTPWGEPLFYCLMCSQVALSVAEESYPYCSAQCAAEAARENAIDGV